MRADCLQGTKRPLTNPQPLPRLTAGRRQRWQENAIGERRLAALVKKGATDDVGAQAVKRGPDRQVGVRVAVDVARRGDAQAILGIRLVAFSVPRWNGTRAEGGAEVEKDGAFFRLIEIRTARRRRRHRRSRRG